MPKNINKKFYTTALLFTVFFTVNNTNAESFVNNNRLAFDFFGTVSNFFKVNNASSTESIGEFQVEDKEAQSVKKSEKMNICEIHDNTFLNTLLLSSNSADAQARIEKIEDTIEEEMLIRENIFLSANNKNLSNLQKKEKLVFGEMEKEIDNAKKYYLNVEGRIVAITNDLEENDCEDLNKKQERQLNSNFIETEELLEEEGVFRKEFSSSLRDKMSVLSKKVKEVKK